MLGLFLEKYRSLQKKLARIEKQKQLCQQVKEELIKQGLNRRWIEISNTQIGKINLSWGLQYPMTPIFVFVGFNKDNICYIIQIPLTSKESEEMKVLAAILIQGDQLTKSAEDCAREIFDMYSQTLTVYQEELEIYKKRRSP